jgi:hypothetical protein
MEKFPNRYNTDGIMDLNKVWNRLISKADNADKKQLLKVAKEILKKLRKPITEENLNIVVNNLQKQIVEKE